MPCDGLVGCEPASAGLAKWRNPRAAARRVTRWRRAPLQAKRTGAVLQCTPVWAFGSLAFVPLERLSVIWPCAALYRTLQVTTYLITLPENAVPLKFPTRDSMKNPL